MTMRTQLLLGYALPFILMTIIAFVNDKSNQTVLNGQQLMQHTTEVMNHGDAAKNNLVTLQTIKRGFFLSGNIDDLERYQQARAAYENDLEKLRELVKDNPGQMILLDDISDMATNWLDLSAKEIDQRKQLDAEPAEIMHFIDKFYNQSEARKAFDTITEKIDRFIANERKLFANRSETAAGNVRVNNILIYSLTCLSILAGMAGFLFTTRRIIRQVGGEPADIERATRQIALGDLVASISGETGIAASVQQLLVLQKELTGQAKRIASGNYLTEIKPRSDKDELITSLSAMTAALRQAQAETEAREWLQSGLARLSVLMQGDPEPGQLANRVITEMAQRLDANIAAFYILEHDQTLQLAGSYAFLKDHGITGSFQLGEGLVGQAAVDGQQLLVSDVPDNYISIASGLGEHKPRYLCLTPVSHEGRLKGVIEIGSFHALTPLQLDYLQQATPALAIAVSSAQARTLLNLTLAESQQLTEELQAQQEELKAANEELEEQTQRLTASEMELTSQQEKLQLSNEELREKNSLLDSQKSEVELARRELSEKALELETVSRYKSEFLANMSNELRTPLNSLLLLAQSLSHNKSDNLTPEQLESVQVIYNSGTDLLNLINEILDLSKIEAGQMAFHPETVALAEIKNNLTSAFKHMAEAKKLAFSIEQNQDIPAQIVTDQKRLEQILRNLLSNAIKFTQTGSVSVVFSRPSAEADLSNSGLAAEQTLAITVADTGIGIPPDKQKLIFEAFQQADGTTTRKYGGTGLGLTISRELAALLTGEIQLHSTPGQGSRFTLYVPFAPPARKPSHTGQAPAATPAKLIEPADRAKNRTLPAFIPDDRDSLDAGKAAVLIIEDDPDFAAILRDCCHDRGLNCLAARTGEEGLELTNQFAVAAVILDQRLPGLDGMTVLAALKENTKTRHIPVHVVSADNNAIESLQRGAIGHAVKPLDLGALDAVFRKFEDMFKTQPKRVLVIEDDDAVRREIVNIIGNGTVKVDQARSGAEALQAMQNQHYDCLVLDLKLPDMSGRELLAGASQAGLALPPVIVHTALELSPAQEAELREYAESIVVKGIRSLERLLDEVSLFLHRVVSQMPDKQRRIITELYDPDKVLKNRKVLVADDDMRTAFAISKLLTEYGMQSFKAENGERALQVLNEHPDIDIVLMDVMMPVMDGYEATRRIRAQERFQQLPVIALTAKAMPEDREKCLAAGTSDYMTKPVDEERLFSLMRIWLQRRQGL